MYSLFPDADNSVHDKKTLPESNAETLFLTTCGTFKNSFVKN